MTRSGEMSRSEAIAKATEEENKDVSQVLDTFKAKLGISSQDIEAAKAKTHLAYLQ